MESPFPDDETTQTIARCVEAMGDLDRLRDELHSLRLSSDPRAQFATALFDLDRAQRGDPEARNELIDVADRLLVFWREGSGLDLASGIPELEELWASAASLLVSFEQKRFNKALKTCWEVRANPTLLEEAIGDLHPSGNRRVEFARCLYHLELAREFVERSRAEFARRAGLLSEAYQVEEIATELVGDDEGLAHLWNDLKPYLDEFFETMEEEAARRARAQAIAAAEAEIAAQRDGPPRDFLKTDPGTMAAVRPPPLDDGQVPSFRTLMERTGSGEFAAVSTQPLSEENVVEAVEALDEAATESLAAPPPPPALTPAEFPAVDDDVVDLVEEAEALLQPPAPPAPPDLTPPGQWIPGADGDVEIVDAEDAPPPPPPALTPVGGVPIPVPKRPRLDLDLALDEPDPDNDTIAFWHFTAKKLDLLPDPKQPRAARRLLNVENRGDRKRLTEYLEASEPYAKQNADARAFACLVRLMLAGQLKEKSLFGQPNARRREAFGQALALLSTDPRAAGHAAVWFELDGPETLTSLRKGLEVLTDFLSWCAKERRDPLDELAQADFLGATP